MRLTKREKILLVLLGVVLSCFLYYQFVFLYENARITALREEYTGKTNLLKLADRKDARIREIQSEIEILDKEISVLRKKISVPLLVPDLLVELGQTASRNGVKIENVVFSGSGASVKGEFRSQDKGSEAFPQMKSLQGVSGMVQDSKIGQTGASAGAGTSAARGSLSGGGAAAGQGAVPDSGTFPGLNTMVMDIAFSGSYTGCMEFLRYYEKKDGFFIVNTLEIAGSGEKCSGKVSIAAYTLSRIDSEFKYDTVGGSGRTSPFR